MRVNGVIATIKIINGIDRKILITISKIVYTTLCCKIPPPLVITRITPIGNPMITDISNPTLTIYNVSLSELNNSGQNHGSKLIWSYLLYDCFLRLHKFNSLRSEEHTSELQSRENLVCRLLL